MENSVVDADTSNQKISIDKSASRVLPVAIFFHPSKPHDTIINHFKNAFLKRGVKIIDDYELTELSTRAMKLGIQGMKSPTSGNPTEMVRQIERSTNYVANRLSIDFQLKKQDAFKVIWFCLGVPLKPTQMTRDFSEIDSDNLHQADMITSIQNTVDLIIVSGKLF